MSAAAYTAHRPHGSQRFWAALLIGLVVAGCREPAPPRLECPPFEPLPERPDSLEAAREAHRRAELRRHLRFEEAREPGATLRLTARMVPSDRVRAGQVCFGDLYEAGRLLFEHEYSFADGLGCGDAPEQPRGPFRRVQQGERGGPETISCLSCHWRGGPGGGGAVQDNSFLLGDGDRPHTADPRNPPPLFGAGVIQALAREMTAELAATRQALIERAARTGRAEEARLVAKGVDFGVLRVDAGGAVDTSGVEGVDADLVIRPFGWKGNFASLREFIAESLHQHMGITTEEFLAGGHDSDGGGDEHGDAGAELGPGQLTALVVYVAALGMPRMAMPPLTPPMPPAAPGLRPLVPMRFDDDWLRGRELFGDIGCASCHTPVLVLKELRFVTRGRDGSEYEVDLAARAEPPRLEYDDELGGYPVWLFSDLKRHDMGQENASRYRHRGVPEAGYMTRRLWGLAGSSPYFYDGRASWLDGAIMAHGGEAGLAREEFAALDHDAKNALRLYLMSLRRDPRPVVP